MSKPKKLGIHEPIALAAEAHTNLNIFAAVVSLLEGGHLYSSGACHTATSRIIRICKAEEIKWLAEYDRNVALARKYSGEDRP